MKTTSQRRQLIVFILLGLALLGGALRHWAANPSLAHDIGTLMLVLWLPVIGNVVAFIITRVGQKRRQGRTFAPGAPFTPHLWAEIAPTPATGAGLPVLPPGDSTCALVVGTEGFTARLEMPVARWLAQAPTGPVALELLRPLLALPRLPVSTPFRVVAQGRVIGEGQVLELARQPAAATAPAP